MGDGQLLIRPMEERDIAQVARIEAESFSTPWSAEAFRKSLALDYTIFLTAEWEGRVAGYCGCYVSLEEADGRGIARALLLELLRQGEARGAKAFLLEVRAGNAPAIRLYEGLGFEREGMRRNFYEQPREDALVMWKRFPAL